MTGLRKAARANALAIPLVAAIALSAAGSSAASDHGSADQQTSPEQRGGRARLRVATSGADTNPCTQRAPCRTLNRAYQVAKAGQVVEIAAGDYGDQTVAARRISAKSRFVVFQPTARASVRISRLENLASRVEYRKMKISAFYNYGFNGGTQDGVVFRNIDAQTFCIGGGRNIYVLGGDVGPSLSSNATGQQQPCVAKFPGQSSPAPTNVVIDRVRFHDHNHADGRHTECLQVGGVSGLTVRRSTFRNCAQTASIHIGRYDARWPSRDVLIENNFFLRNTGSSSEPVGNIQYNRSEPGLVIRYNSFTGSGGYSILATFDFHPPASPSARIYGNAAYQPGHSQPDHYGPCDRLAVYSHNVWRGASCSPTDVNANPRFTSLANLHLRPGSPAINRGDTTNYPKRDIDGNRRPVGRAPDSGADERRPRRN